MSSPPRLRLPLVPGRKRPYDTWTFLELPEEVARAWPAAPLPVRGLLAGQPFRGTASRGEGRLRMPVTTDLLAAAGVVRGEVVDVEIEPDPEPRLIAVPPELEAVLDADRTLAEAWSGLPPSCRRAWAGHVAEAKRAETRQRRAAAARAGILARRFPGE